MILVGALAVGALAFYSPDDEYPDVKEGDDPGEGGGDPRPATTGERNALDKARSYLSWMRFSEQGLYDQLEYDGFTEAEARYGVANCGADWQEQADKAAKSYLASSHMGPAQLRYQLRDFEKFTAAQTEKAMQSLGDVDWQYHADLRAEHYSGTFSQSKAATYEDLVREGFTEDQARKAVDKAYE